jgi:hypothetical protein
MNQKKSTLKLVELTKALHTLNASKFTGYLKINFSQGSIGRVEKFEEILRDHDLYPEKKSRSQRSDPH